MKFNKWTVGLAAVGAVSMASVAVADESTNSSVASLSSTILSGYVDTSAQWNLGSGDSHAPAYKYGGAAKSDGFNLNAVKLALERPLDENDWAAGYKVELMMGPDANVLGTVSTGTSADFAIRQAYVILRAPIGTGLDFKMGVFDSIVGYESTDAIYDPNFTRSWGHSFEPAVHTGVLGTYHFNSSLALSFGVADTTGPAIDGRSGVSVANNVYSESYKTYMASAALTAPDDWGFLAGSTLYGGFVNGWNNNAATDAALGGEPQLNLYVGTTLATPVTGWRVGGSWDYAHADTKYTPNNGYTAHSFALYTSLQASEKLSLHGRIEYADISGNVVYAAQKAGTGLPGKVFSMTGTIQYDLWKNVLSRLELRWDRSVDGNTPFGGTGPTSATGFTGTLGNSWIIAANIAYKF
jgi:hypothetical protein